jgi:hypothetical protein
MPNRASDPSEAGALLEALETRISRLRFTAQVQELVGKPGEAAGSRDEAGKLQVLLDLLRTTAGYLAAWERQAAH